MTTSVMSGPLARRSFPMFGMTAHVLVTDPATADDAAALVEADLAAFDAVASRFRPDSEISALNAGAGRPFRASPALFEAVEVALDAARLTGGAVDPTVGSALVRIGYDRDFALVRAAGARPEPVQAALEPLPVPGWRRVRIDAGTRVVSLEAGVSLDLGATGKALAADRSAERAWRRLGCGVMVSIGGDVAMAGSPPPGGWVIGVSDVCDGDPGSADTVVAVDGGGLATSGTAARSWRRGGRPVHHLVDPATGLPAATPWRTVSVAAGTCVLANAAATAAMVKGRAAPAWLSRLGRDARLAPVEGPPVFTGDWPPDAPAAGPAAPGPDWPEARW